MKLSFYQENILNFFKEHPTENMYINALAGSGKTSTIIKMTEETKTSDVYIAFNKSIAEECKAKIKNPKTKVYTIHSLAYSIMNANLKSSNESKKGFGSRRSETINEAKLDNLKIHKIIDDIIIKKLGRYIDFTYKFFLKDNYYNLYNLCRVTCTDYNNIIGIQKLIKDYSLFIDTSDECYTRPSLETITKWLKEIDRISLNQFEESKLIDFTDMLYITFLKLRDKEWEVPYYHYYTNIYIDESQDQNTLQLLFLKYIKRKNGRYIFVLDEHQAIYMFAGANSQACNLIPKLFAPITKFDLPICYRCPKKHLNRVNQYFKIPIEAREGANEGEIITINKPDIYKYVKAGDMIISRKNKWFADVILDLVVHGISIYIEDVDMVNSILKIVKNLKSSNCYDAKIELKNQIIKFEKNIKKNINLEEGLSVEEQEKMVKEISSENTKIDNINFVLKIIDSYLFKQSNEMISIDNFEIYLKKILNCTPNNNSVRICSIHKAKGLEAENVFVLNEAKVERTHRMSVEQLKQEKNLSYIAITRARNCLYLVKEDD